MADENDKFAGTLDIVVLPDYGTSFDSKQKH